jgi:hypothetical protein
MPDRADFQIVVSTENNPYSAWQSKLFYYSCVTKLQRQPAFLVHDTASEFHPDFLELARSGATVVRAPNYRMGADSYPPRNTPGSLLHAAQLFPAAEFLVLCDPDMLFLRSMDFPTALCAQHYSYMDYSAPSVTAAAERFGVSMDALTSQGRSVCCGVPYIIPRVHASAIASLWLQAIDSFPTRSWIDVMYAFGFAVTRLGLSVQPLDWVDDNDCSDNRLTRDVIHYWGGDALWDKRHFFTADEAARVWNHRPDAPAGSVLQEVLKQIAEARRFYANPYFAAIAP